MKQTLTKKMIPLLFLSCAFSSLSALEWPVSQPLPSSFFGQRAFGIIERGIVLDKVDTIRASDHGTLMITLSENKNMSGFPGTLGNAVILAHDEGLLTIYGNLDSVDRIDEQLTVESGSILGQAGKSGWGKAVSCIFQVIDREQHTVLNPLLLLPQLQDTHGPTIKDVIVISSNEQIYALGTTKSVKQGKYRLYADIPDTINASPNNLSPFRITIEVNGSEYSSIPFELLKETNGEVYLSSPTLTWKNLYKDPVRIYLGELTLTRGRADISIIARDTAGNERSVLFGLQIE
jgi:hypothetical protein